MSAGIFQFAKYETESGEVVRVRAQPESLALTLNSVANAESADAVTIQGIFPLNLGGRRRKPFSARYVAVQFTAAAPTGYKASSVCKVPVYSKATYSGLATGQTGTYLGVAVKVVGKSNHQGDL
jgi:hypothetical protein